MIGGKDRATITSERVYQIPGFRMYEAIVRRDLTDNTMDIFPSVKQQAEVGCVCVCVRLCTFVCAHACIWTGGTHNCVRVLRGSSKKQDRGILK